ncbi:septal ring lytic transglycosylase RlpA family protein [Borrelia persica]|uniref:septal ring lytic transglycosylase RlpA family protein n=1 Tax=Borrelia persica TaxID=44448 RepID=UPI000466B11F|nr:septal ring lytic transglycosylase RlpA family protein [Borrelia persica]
MVSLFDLMGISVKFMFLFLFFATVQLNSATVGLASWYGEAFHGKTTANGEKFDMTALTAAHKELPFNSVVRVTNLLNNRTVVVRINDRGPFRKDRIIDLSKSAAEKLDFIGIGVAPVKIEILEQANAKGVKAQKSKENVTQESKKESKRNVNLKDASDTNFGNDVVDLKADKSVALGKEHTEVAGQILNDAKEPDFYIQVGSYKTKDYAERAYKILKGAGLSVFVNSHGPFFTVFVPTYADDVQRNVELVKSTGYKDILIRKTKIPGDSLLMD